LYGRDNANKGRDTQGNDSDGNTASEFIASKGAKGKRNNFAYTHGAAEDKQVVSTKLATSLLAKASYKKALPEKEEGPFCKNLVGSSATIQHRLF